VRGASGQDQGLGEQAPRFHLVAGVERDEARASGELGCDRNEISPDCGRVGPGVQPSSRRRVVALRLGQQGRAADLPVTAPQLGNDAPESADVLD
jgi:hypothetical protein